jgi:glucosylceramidase
MSPVLRPLLLALLLPAGLASASPWSVVETARANGHRLTPVAAPAPAAAAPGGAVLRVDPAVRFQEMIGFGGALTESSAWVLAQLPPERRQEVIAAYFSPEGHGYTLARTHINSCDFSLSMWSLAETPGDYELHDFSLAPMRRWLMPLLHDAARAAGADRLRLMASPWSPPPWMKTNFRMDDGGRLRREYAPSWARFFVKFIESMQREEGLRIWAVTVQNEPQAHQVWESCLYTPEQERDFIRDHLGPALEKAGLAHVKLIAHDHNRDILEAHADAILGDPATAKYVWGLGLHWYVSNDFAASARVLAKYPDKPILFTEGCWEGGKDLGVWAHGEAYVRQMLGDFRHGVSAFIDWNIVLDQRGGPNHVGNFCDAPIIVDTTTKEVRYSAAFYYLGHFSRHVPPGSRRVASSGGPEGLESIAFARPDGRLAVVVMNPTAAPVAFALDAGAGAVACRIPAHGIQTYVHTP